MTAQTPGSARPPTWLVPVQTANDESLPSWLQFNGQYRNRVEHSGGIRFERPADTYDLSQLRLEVIIHPVNWLTLVGETQDAEAFFNQRIPSAPPYQNTWDIRQAYIKLGDSKNGWVDFVAGREMLSFGEERLIGPSDWLNMGRTFDTLHLTLHHPGVKVSLFASSVIVARDGVIDHHIQGNNLHGMYASFDRILPGSVIEPYVLWRVAPAGVKLAENAGRGHLNEVTTGMRLAGKLPAKFNYGVEMALQTGSLGPDSIHAWAGHWLVGRTFEPIPAKPRVFVEANHASGTKDPNSRSWGTFDQLYPSSHNKLGFADQVGWRNIEQWRAGVEQNLAKWKFTETYEDFRLASIRDGLYASSGALLAQSPLGSTGRHVGREFDAWAEWQWRKTVEVGFGYAQFFSGEFLKRTTAGRDYHYPFFYVTYHLTKTPEN